MGYFLVFSFTGAAVADGREITGRMDARGGGKETYRPLNLHLVIPTTPLLLLPPHPRHLGPHPAPAPHLGLDVLPHRRRGRGALRLEVAVEGGDLRGGGVGLGEEGGELRRGDDGAEVGGEEEVGG